MDTRDLLILGGIGAAAWFFFFRRQAAAQPITATDPTAAAGMTPGAAAQTQTGSAFVRGITGNASPLGGAPAVRNPFGSGGGAFGVYKALQLTAKDNNPVPNPPAAPNAFFSPILGVTPVVGTGSGSTGPNPTAYSLFNRYPVFGR